VVLVRLHCLVVRGKDSYERSVYLSPQAERALRAYQVERPPAALSIERMKDTPDSKPAEKK
jgi:site-specific recombinase XerD